MKTFHWASLGVASSMVAVLIGAAVIMPSPSGLSVAQASFTPVARAEHTERATVRDYVKAASNSLVNFVTASGSAKALPSSTPKAMGYDLKAVFKGGEVPRLALASLPGNLSTIRETDERKAMFFKSILPLVLQVNEQILQDRQRLWDISAAKKAGIKLDATDRLWLAVMAERYGTRRGDVQALLRHHDVVPPSLALAQAATESAWGTSRFVREGNAIFGEWTFGDDTDGIVPSERGLGKTHRVRAFDSPQDSVMSYVTNLNKHRAYKEFRALRADMRAKGQILDGKRLAATLYRYSERGSAYVDELDSIIDGNDLEQLDNARLTDAHGVDPVI